MKIVPASTSYKSSFVDIDQISSKSVFEARLDSLSSAITSVSQSTVDRIDDAEKEWNTQFVGLRSDISDLAKKIEDSKASMPAPQSSDECKCDCDCPTAEEIADLVIAKLKQGGYLSSKSATAAISSDLNGFKLNPGERLVEVDGVPVNQTSRMYSAPVYASPAPTRYMAPAPIRGFFRSGGTCGPNGCN